jgi:hypothetical protein
MRLSRHACSVLHAVGVLSSTLPQQHTQLNSTQTHNTKSAELFTLTYGSIVRQLIADLEDLDEVNRQLDTMCVFRVSSRGWFPTRPGLCHKQNHNIIQTKPNKHQSKKRGYNIGVRIVDEFLAKSRTGRCASFREAAEVVARQALPMFLNVGATVTNWSADGTECSLVRRWWCGVLRGGYGGGRADARCTLLSATTYACHYKLGTNSPNTTKPNKVLADNPLADFVELPDEYRADLQYSALLAGAVRGALEMVSRLV